MDDITFVRSHCGWCRRVFHYRPPTPMYRNSPPLCTIVLQIPRLCRLKCVKSSWDLEEIAPTAFGEG